MSGETSGTPYKLRTRSVSITEDAPSTPKRNTRARLTRATSESKTPDKQMSTPSAETPRMKLRERKPNNYCENEPPNSLPQAATKSKTRSRKGSTNQPDEAPTISLDPLQAELEKELNEIEETTQKPSELFDDNDTSGNKIYQFQTPSKKNAMVEKALSSRTPSKQQKTPTKNLRVLVEKKELPSTPTTSRKKLPPIPENPTTPRNQTRKRLSAYLGNDSESESVSEDEEWCQSDAHASSDDDDDESEEVEDHSNDDDEDEDEEKNNKSPRKLVKGVPARKIQVPITPCRRSSRNKIIYQDYHMKTDDYFSSQSEKAVTSDHTLSRLKNPRLNEEKVQELLSNENHVSDVHKKSICSLTETCRSQFPMWYHIMEEGYSLLLHGLGSKRNIIHEFHDTMIDKHPTFVVNGFFPSLTIKEILEGIITDLLELDCPTNPVDCFNLIDRVLRKNPDDRLYLLIHNIDGVMLRPAKAQDVLSRLAAIPNVRLLASVDHINSPLLWDNVKRSRYNFYWWDATTFLPYEAETSYESSLLVQKSGALMLSSLRNVFASLTSNAKNIYKILVKYQIENGNASHYPGMAFKDLYRRAKENFFVNADPALRAQLTEFIDHKLVRTKRTHDGTEHLVIPLDNSLLTAFMEEFES